jgi:formate dehydrogenase gamma subunit
MTIPKKNKTGKNNPAMSSKDATSIVGSKGVLDKKRLYIIFIILIIIGAGIVISVLYNKLLIDKYSWLLIVSALTGIISAVIGRFNKKSIPAENGQVVTHKISGFISHWLTALGIMTLLTTGFVIGFLFFPYLTDTPMSVLAPLNVHFVGIIVVTFGGFYFFTDYLLSKRISTLVPSIRDITQGTIKKYILKQKYEKEGKYLSSQKSAFLVFALLGGMLFITGIVKVLAHSWQMSSTVMAVSTQIHDVFALLFVIMLLIHVIMALLVKGHRVLLKSWFTGKISEQYVKKENNAWYEELQSVQPDNGTINHKGKQI